MAVDLSQFHQVFLEESYESLDVMEASLMELDPSAIDAEIINTIFRAAHSIKGGAGTFGFSNIADFTHVLETLLDDIRAGKRGISQDDIDLFLQSVDCIRAMLNGHHHNDVVDMEAIKQVQQQFEQILAQSLSQSPPRSTTQSSPQAANAGIDTVASDASSSDETAAIQNSSADADEPQPSREPGAETSKWIVDFKPGPDILRTGNEPLRMFRELREKASLEVAANAGSLPAFSNMEPENCYLRWRLQIEGKIRKEEILEVFEWVADEAEIHIQAVEANPLVNHIQSTSTASQCETATSASGWRIQYRPGTDTLRTGNDSLRLFRELRSLGPLQVVAQLDQLPSFETMHPEQSYLAWELSLAAPVDRQAIAKVFEWVEDESGLVIEPLVQQTDNDFVQALAAVSGDNIVASLPKDSEKEPSTAVPASPSPSTVAAPRNTAKPGSEGGTKETNSIRVAIDKIDNLINMVGELVITQSMLGQIGTNFSSNQLPRLLEGLSQLEHNTRELQESVMRIRMLPISFAFSRFPRMVRDLGRRMGKQIELVLMGEQTELDKTVMERIGDPLVHLVRNAVDHGIETPDVRSRQGKNECGRIVLNAYHQSGNVVIEVIDDGKGLSREKLLNKALTQKLISENEANTLTDTQVFDLIFHPGFSTADQVSDVSGRGVGMDVVKRNIQELNGSVDIRSDLGAGTTITIRLPLTLAILDGQLVRVGTNTYIFPLVSIVESLQVDDEAVNEVAGGCQVFKLRDEYVPVIKLHEIFAIDPDSYQIKDSLLVVVESDGDKVGVIVDELAAQQQVVIKSLEQNYKRIEGVSGATILGDGTVSLILDVPGMVKLAGVQHVVGDKTYRYAEKPQAMQAKVH